MSTAMDEVASLYEEQTIKEDKNPRALHDAIKVVAKVEVKSLWSKFDKLSAIGNPKYGT